MSFTWPPRHGGTTSDPGGTGVRFMPVDQPRNALPGWFSTGLYLALIWTVTAGVSALAMLSKTTYSSGACSIIATLAAAASWPWRPRAREGERPAHGAAVVAVAIASVLLIVAGVSHSEHLLTDRDPAVYINTGRSIARTHEVHPTIEASPFDDYRTFATRVAGFAVSRHHLFSNFLDFLPALLAIGWSAGGDNGLLLVPALIGALALLALYALATTVVGPRWALLGPALLTLAPLQSWFSRDAFAELPLELLALGGLWLFIEARRNGGVVAAMIAGIVLGSITFVRIDALMILVALPAVLAVEHLRAASLERPERRRRRRVLRAFAISVLVAALAGSFVSRRLTPGYMTNLSDNLELLEVGFVLGIAAAACILAVHRIHAGIGRRIGRSRIVITLASLLTLALAGYAYKLRPRTGNPKPLSSSVITPAARRAFDQFFVSSSFRWFAWYLGTVTLAFIVVGFIVLGVRATRYDSPALVVLAAAVPATLLYIARPSVSPDHLWAMRRYIPIVLPVMTIAAAAAASWSTSAIGEWRPRLRAPLVLLAVGAMLAPAAAAGEPLIGAQSQGGTLDAVHHLCRVAGPHAAIAVEPYALLGLELPQTLRGFCGVLAAGIRDKAEIPLAQYLPRWKHLGRRFFIATAARQPVLAAFPAAVLVAHVVVRDTREPERTFGRRPRRYTPQPIEVWLYRVDPI
jgi:hypothetical protein